MTDTPAASNDAPTAEANTKWAMKIASHLTHIPQGDLSQRERALVFLNEAVATLTAKLEAERAKVSELADERDSFAGELDEANEKLDFIRDIEGALKAETARETARADAAVAEVKALREENDTLRGIVATSALDCVYCGLPASRMAECASGFPGCGRADDIAARATLAQPAADGGK